MSARVAPQDPCECEGNRLRVHLQQSPEVSASVAYSLLIGCTSCIVKAPSLNQCFAACKAHTAPQRLGLVVPRARPTGGVPAILASVKVTACVYTCNRYSLNLRTTLQKRLAVPRRARI